MRLIDADALKQGFESSDFDDDPFENVDNACRIVNSYPTIPAIPVEWLQEKIKEHTDREGWQDYLANSFGLCIEEWQKEQEVR